MKIQVCLIAFVILAAAVSDSSGISPVGANGSPRLVKRSLLPSVRVRYHVPRVFIRVVPVGYHIINYVPSNYPAVNLHLQPPYPPPPGLSVLPPYAFFR